MNRRLNTKGNWRAWTRHYEALDYAVRRLRAFFPWQRLGIVISHDGEKVLAVRPYVSGEWRLKIDPTHVHLNGDLGSLVAKVARHLQ